MTQKIERRILIGITGASGSVYGERLIDFLRTRVERVYVVATESGMKVARHELKPRHDGFSLARLLEGDVDPHDRAVLRVLKNDDLFAPVASGSSAPTAMAVVPCSMGSLARISHGLSSNLLERAADVCLKQRVPLVLCPRETPLSTIHLRNMLSLSEMGVRIVPPMPGFYQAPKTIDDMIDFVVGKVLEQLDVAHDLYPAWNARMR